MNIVLIGYRCSGKTTVGKILAEEMGLDFVDMDALIETNAGCSIEAIVSRKGWGSFRDMERKLAEDLSHGDDLVIATGGGIVTDRKNVERLKQNGWIVWLNAKEDILMERMEEENKSGKARPSLTGTDPLKEINEVLAVRKPLYKKAASFVVDTSRLPPDEAALVIMKEFQTELKG